MTGSKGSTASDLPTTAGVPPPRVPGAPRSPAGGAPAASEPSSAVQTAAPPARPAARSGSLSSALPKVCPSCQARYPADFKVCPRDASPLKDAGDDGSDPLLGATLGDAYQIVRIVGEGGMGRVYEARHTRLGNKRFAVKMLHAEYARQNDVVARFQREAEAASGIAHPNVVDVYDVHHTEDGRPYMVGEFLEGEELGDFLRRKGKIEVGLAVRIVRQVCRALGAAHARGVVHRDMKPENVFLVGDPQNPIVKVIDFGISKVGDAGGAALTRTGMIMGTPSYMAPEQARGDKVDHRADIYAVGGILYRALTGKKPFDSDDPSATLSMVLTEDPERPRALEGSIPQALELVIQRAMAKEPGDRPSSMAELEADLVPFDPDPVPYGGSPNSSGATQISGPRSKEVVEAGAETMLVVPGGTSASHTNLFRATRDAAMARPMIAMLTVVGYVWVLASVVDALGGIVRIVRGAGSNITRTEALLITLGALAATLTPLILWVRQLVKWWGNSVRAVQLAEWMRRVMTVSITASGIGALLIRLFQVTVRSEASNLAWPVWSIVLFGASVLGGLVAYLSIKFERRGR